MNLSRLLRAMPIALAVSALLTGSAMAQTAAAPEEPGSGPQLVSSNWTVACRPDETSEELLCEASQTIAEEQTRQPLITVYVTPWKQEGRADSFILRFQLPHGLNIPAGIQVTIDDAPAPSPVVQTSDQQAGLFAMTHLTVPLLASLKKGSTMTVAFSAMNGTTFAIPMTLKGFSAVYGKLQ